MSSTPRAVCLVVFSLLQPFADARLAAWLDIIEASGLRCIVAPWYASADWSTRNGHEVEYLWDEAAGRRHFAAAIALAPA